MLLRPSLAHTKAIPPCVRSSPEAWADKTTVHTENKNLKALLYTAFTLEKRASPQEAWCALLGEGHGPPLGHLFFLKAKGNTMMAGKMSKKVRRSSGNRALIER